MGSGGRSALLNLLFPDGSAKKDFAGGEIPNDAWMGFQFDGAVRGFLNKDALVDGVLCDDLAVGDEELD